MARLGDVGEIVTGNTPPTGDSSNYNSKDICFIKPSDMANDEIYRLTLSEFYISENARKIARILPPRSVLVSCIGSIGKVAINAVECAFNQQINAIIPNESICISEYLAYALQYMQPVLQQMANAPVVPIINKKQFSQIQIPLHKMDYQREVVSHLNALEKIIAKQRQHLTKLDELVKSRFVEMFGGIHDSTLYPYKPVSSFTIVKSGGTPDRGIPEYWNNGNIRWVKTTELQNCIVIDTEEKITELAINNSSAKLIPAHSILVAMYGQGKTRGMTGYLAVESTTNQACACILPSEAINQKYLWHYMILSYDKLRDMAKGGNQPNLNAGIIKAFPVLIPPLELQNQFADFVTQVDKSKLAVKQSLEKLETLKKSLMQQYFG